MVSHAKITDVEKSQDVRTFSVIKFFARLEKAIAKINTYPLTKDNLVIQQDAYKRLGSVPEEGTPFEDEELLWTAFATLDCSRKERDTDMRFAIEFFPEWFVLTMEGMGSFSFDYELFEDEASGEQQVIDCLTMLANGQIANLVTLRNGYACATETLLYGPSSRIPTVIGTEGKYPWWLRAEDETGYDTQLLRNRYELDRIATPKRMFLLERGAAGKLKSKGRTFTTAELTPLTKAQFTLIRSEIFMRQAGKQPNESHWGFFYRSWEFWLAIAIFIGAMYGGGALGIVPRFVTDHPAVTWPLSIFLLYAVLVPLLHHKQHLLEAHPDHPWIRFDRFLHHFFGQNFLRSALVICALGSIALTFGPIFAQSDHHAVNLLTFAAQHPVAYTIPAAFLLAAGLVWAGGRRLVLSGLGLIILGALALGGMDFAWSSDADAPEPYSTLSIIVYVLLPIIYLWLLIRMVRRPKEVSGVPAAELTTTEEVEPAPPSRWLSLLPQLVLLVSYASALGIYQSARLLRTILKPAFFDHGSPALFIHGLIAVAIALAVATVATQLGLITQRLLLGFSTILAVATFLSMGIMLNDKSNGGPSAPWLLLFGSVFAQLGISNLLNFKVKRQKERELKDKTLDK